MLVPRILDGSQSGVDYTCKVSLKVVCITSSLFAHADRQECTCIPIIRVETTKNKNITEKNC